MGRGNEEGQSRRLPALLESAVSGGPVVKEQGDVLHSKTPQPEASERRFVPDPIEQSFQRRLTRGILCALRLKFPHLTLLDTT